MPIEIVTVDRGKVTEVGLGEAVSKERSGAQAYVEATLTCPGPYELYETLVVRMAGLAIQIVQIQSPVHIDEVVARVRDAFVLKRAKARILAPRQAMRERAVI